MSTNLQPDTKNNQETIYDIQSNIELPPEYKVVLYNDDFTPMDFVVKILERIFQKEAIDAERIMRTVHLTGSCVAAVYTYDIAATKVKQVKLIAEKNGHPLRCEMEQS